jgi:O-antigen/teichoic acid export membrane protein
MKSIYQVFSFDILSKVLIGLIGIVLIRYMAEGEYALYTFTLSIVAVVSQTIASTFRRIYIVGFKNFNLDRNNAVFLGLQMLLILFFILLSLPFTTFNGMFIWTIIMIVGFVVVEFVKTNYQKTQDFKKYSLIEISRSASFFLLIMISILFLRHEIKAWHIFLIQSSTMILIFLLSQGRMLGIKHAFKVKEAFYMGKGIFFGSYKFLVGYTLVATLLGQIDIFMLKYYSNESELATYGSAFRYYSLILLALTSINAVFLPTIQKISSQMELRSFYKKHTELLLVLIPLIIIGAWLSSWIIPLIDMGKYPGAVNVFQILSISAIISLIFSPHANLLMKFEKFKLLFTIVSISILMSVILNSIMIPVLGSLGAAIATFITFGFNNITTFIFAQKSLKNLSN